MYLRYKVDDRAAQRLFKNLVNRFSYLNAEAKYIEKRVDKDIKQHFVQTVNPQGKWKQLSAKWAKKKAKLRPGKPILVFDGKLKESLAKGFNKRTNPRGVYFSWSSNLPYAPAQNWGYSKINLPAREYGWISEPVLSDIANYILRDI